MAGDKDNQHQSYTVDTPDMDWADEWDDDVDVDVPDLEDIDDDIDIDVPTSPAVAQNADTAAPMADTADVPDCHVDRSGDISLPTVDDSTVDAPDVMPCVAEASIDAEPVENNAADVDIDTADNAPETADNAVVGDCHVDRSGDISLPTVEDNADIDIDIDVPTPTADAPAEDAADNNDVIPSDVVTPDDTDTPVEAGTTDVEPSAVEGSVALKPVENPPVEAADTENSADNAEGAADSVDKTAEQLAQEAEQLEQYRSQMGESTAELADVSEYKNFRKQTKSAGKDTSKNKTSDFDIFANRYKAKTLNAAVAATDPIVYFYNACLRANGTVMLFNVYQVLQDRFVGKLIPQLFTSVAEASSKIEELNLANLLAQLPVCQEYPQYDFVISISARFFTKPAILEKLLRNIPDPVPANLVMAFDCVSLQNIGVAAKTGLGALKERGIKVLLDNTERVSMTTLTDLDYDYIRVDSRYYEMGNPRAESFLRLILDMAKEQNVGTVATYCDNEDMAEYMLYMGVDAVQGNACSRPMRTVPNAIKAVTLLQSMLDS